MSALSANAASVTVRIVDFWFNPTNVVLRPMDRVIWINTVSNTHDVTRAGLFGSETLVLNETFAFQFNNPGDYPYVCQRHINQGRSQTGNVSVVSVSLASVTATETDAQFELSGGRQGLRAVVEAGVGAAEIVAIS